MTEPIVLKEKGSPADVIPLTRGLKLTFFLLIQSLTIPDDLLNNHIAAVLMLLLTRKNRWIEGEVVRTHLVVPG